MRGEHAPADVADLLDVSLGAVRSALAYHHEHPEEMRELRRRHPEVERALARDALSPSKPAE